MALHEQLRELLAAGAVEDLRRVVAERHESELAEAFAELDQDERGALLRLLDTETAADVFSGAEEAIQEELADALTDAELAELVEEMDSDEAADTVRLLEPEEQDRVFDLLEDETESEVRRLLVHEEDTAGDLMMVELAAIHEDAIIAEAIELIREKADEIEELYNVYVIDSARRLVGTLSLRDMVLARPGMPLRAVMEPPEVTVTPEMDQEEVARVFRRYDLVSLPVVDAAGVLVGRITVDDVMDVMEEEAREDISRFAGMGEESFQPRGVLRISRDRLPWLVLGLFGGLLSARILQGFQGSLSRMLSLAFFVPVVTALGGNIGIQSSTIVVRGLATGEFRSGSVRRRILRELAVSLLNGFVIGLVTFGAVWLWLGDLALGSVVAVSMLTVVLWASITGTAVPLLLRRFGVDPAYATGPFVTTTNDIVDLSIYLGIAFHFRDLLT
ncbi:MAG: magnesium transporter [Candidatus Krumholzibacteriota bacterium]|nr:magnesium transporter [Candidatus Krumholzibacteriota bacterium]